MFWSISACAQTADTLVVRDTARKYVNALISPRTSLQRTSIEHAKPRRAGTSELTIVREQYTTEATNPHFVRASVEAVALGADGAESTFDTLRVEEFRQVRAHPTLGYIFFDANSSEIPARYERMSQREASKFSYADLYDREAMDIYHNILNIVGKRLVEHPRATLTLVGCNADIDNEKDNLPLSRARAEAVKNYLNAVWSIAPSRITTTARDLPERPSSGKSIEGREENRRVEIYSDDPEITDVFTAIDTTLLPTPPVIRLRTMYQSASPLQSWSLTVRQKNTVLKRYANGGAPPRNIDWDLQDDERSIPRMNAPLDLELMVKTTAGDVARSLATVPALTHTLKQKALTRALDTMIDRYNLVLFDYGKAELTPEHQRILASLKSRLTPASHIIIEGFADQSGSNSTNSRLALARAAATKKALAPVDAVVRSNADARLLFPNDTPEGRFLCRTVQITVLTPSNALR
ncbi:MAG: OmpA family protein [Bacteroidetes bacterium]|nr:OmpA family protein [Bacteroidota bacterium]